MTITYVCTKELSYHIQGEDNLKTIHNIYVYYDSFFFQSAFDKGEIYLGHKSDDFAVYEGVPPGRSDYGQSFTLRVPDRQYPMSAETVEERDQWIEAIKEVISSPLSAQDAARK